MDEVSAPGTCACSKGNEDQDAAKGNRDSNFIVAPRHAMGQSTCGAFKTGFSNCSHIARHDGLRIKHPVIIQDVSHFEKTFLRTRKMREGVNFSCFRATLGRVAHDYPKIYYRAKAWAIGDISKIEYLKPTNRRSCHWSPQYSAIYAEKYGAQNPHFARRAIIYYQRILKKYPVAVTVLPISDLLSAKGFVYQFRKLGYAITDPQGIPSSHEEHQKLSAIASRKAHA